MPILRECIHMKSIDLNCDMGELKSEQAQNFDSEIMPYISSCNIACGFHSGNPELIESTIKAAIRHGVKIGAHPSYNDREHFGRVSIKINRSVLMAELRYQISAIKGMVESMGSCLNHVKPHGALYNDMAMDAGLANDFVALVKTIDPNLKIFALAHSVLIEVCKKHGMKYVNEGFADRRYEKLNELRSRQFEDAVIHESEEVLAQIEYFLEGKVQLQNKAIQKIKVDSICLHSDTKGAVVLSQIIYQYLKENNVRIAAII